MTPRFITLFVVVLLILKVVNGFITSGPLNAVAEVGGQAIFNCTSDTTLQNWILSKSRNDLGSPAVQNIAINCAIQPGFTVHYEVDRPGGSTNICNLIVKATTMQQAGVYTCSDTAYGPSTILTVIEPTPVLARNSTSAQEAAVEGESVMFECMLNYNGSVAPAPTLRPYFYWTNSIGQNVTSYNDSSTDDLAFSQFTVTAQRGNNITEYTCHVYFKLNLTTTSNYANNTPSVNSSATSLTIEVLYYPEITSLTSTVSTTDNCVYKNETLTCTADAHPPAQYQWLDLSNNAVSSGSVKSISIGGQYQCIASNVIRSQRHNDTKIENLNTCSSPKNVTITGAGCANNSCSCSMNNTSLKLSCTANGYPEPTYIWWSDDPNNQYPGSTSTIDVEFDGNYSCTASNLFGNQNHPETVSIPVYNCTVHLYCFAFKELYICIIVVIFPIYFGLGGIFGVGFVIYIWKTGKQKHYFHRFPFLKRMLPCLNSKTTGADVRPAKPISPSNVKPTDEPSSPSNVKPTDEPSSPSNVKPTDEPSSPSNVNPTDVPSSPSNVKLTDEPSSPSNVKPTAPGSTTLCDRCLGITLYIVMVIVSGVVVIPTMLLMVSCCTPGSEGPMLNGTEQPAKTEAAEHVKDEIPLSSNDTNQKPEESGKNKKKKTKSV